MFKSIINYLGLFFDYFFLPDVENLRKKHKKDISKIDRLIIKNLTKECKDLVRLDIEHYSLLYFVSISFESYDYMIENLKQGKSLDQFLNKDGLKKDLMLKIYNVRDYKNRIWVLVVDMTNSPSIGLKDYWCICAE